MRSWILPAALACFAGFPLGAQTTSDNVTSIYLFETSDAKCAAMKYKWCTSILTPGLTVRRYIEDRSLLVSSILIGNDWPEEMLEEEIPVGKWFIVAANPW